MNPAARDAASARAKAAWRERKAALARLGVPTSRTVVIKAFPEDVRALRDAGIAKTLPLAVHLAVRAVRLCFWDSRPVHGLRFPARFPQPPLTPEERERRRAARRAYSESIRRGTPGVLPTVEP